MISAIPDFLQNSSVRNETRVDVVAWLNEWRLLVRTDPRGTVQQLMEMGWNGKANDLVVVPMEKEKEWELRSTLTRKCIHAFVIGCEGVGKVGNIICSHE